jgi:hypothetical protein
MIRWVKTGYNYKTTGGRSIWYGGMGMPYEIESRREQSPNLVVNSFVVFRDGEEVARTGTMREAKEYAEDLWRGGKA